MAVFYAIEQGLVLHKEGQRLLAKKEGKVKRTIHFHTLEQVVLIGQIGLTPAVISTLLKRNIDTVFLTKSGRYLGRLMPMVGKNIELRLKQFERFKETAFRERIARAIVKGKIENQRLLLRRINRKGLGLEDVILRLKQLAKRAEEADIASLRGIEGTAARFYSVFECLLSRSVFDEMKARVEKIIDPHADSVIYYLLCDHCRQRIDHLGRTPFYLEEEEVVVV